MSADKILDQLAQNGWLTRPMVERLRQQVAAAPQSVTAEGLVRLLVKKGQLTAEQGKRLLQASSASQTLVGTYPPLEEVASPSPTSPPSPPPIPPRPPAAPPSVRPTASRDDDELGLAPDENESQRSGAILSADAALRPAKSGPSLDRPPAVGGAPPARPSVDPRQIDWHAEDARAEEVTELEEATGGDDELDEVAEVAAGTSAARRPRGWAGWMARLAGTDRRRKFTGNRWDSPLILFGTGGLVLLVIVGIGLYFYLARGTGDEAFQAAIDLYRQQAYGQARVGFEEFLQAYPGHPKESLAKVRVGLARLWEQVDTKRWDGALQTAQEVLPPLETEPAFEEARPELASLLPEIAEGFAEKATQAEVAEAAGLLAQAESTLQMVENPSYLPTSVRRDQQPRIEQIQSRLESVRRRLNQDQELQTAIAQMETHRGEGKISEAYAARLALVRKYPQLETHEKLIAATHETALREREAVRKLTELPTPVAAEAPAGQEFHLTLAHRRGDSIEALGDQVVTVAAGGAVYGVRAKNGEVAWRRSASRGPIPVWLDLRERANGDVLVFDERARQLVRCQHATGRDVWQLPCASDLWPPRAGGASIFVATRSDGPGEVWAVDPQTGQVQGGAQLPCPIATSPTWDDERQRLLVVGAWGTLFEIQVSDWTCSRAQYLGHGAHTVVVPPTVIAGTVLICENAGSDFSLLHVWGDNPESPTEWRVLGEPLRGEGQVVVPLTPFGRRILWTNDRGQFQVWELDASVAGQPLRKLAETVAAIEPGAVSFPLLEEGRLWVGDSQLSFYELQAARGQFARKWLNYKGDRFLAAPVRRNDVLFHVRQRAGRAGVIVTASQIGETSGNRRRDGEMIWEAELAAPAAGEPWVDKAAQEIRLLTTSGLLFSADKQSIRQGIVTQARAEWIDAEPVALRTSVPLDEKTRLAIPADLAKGWGLIEATDRGVQMRSVPWKSGGASGERALFAAWGNGVLAVSERGPMRMFDARSSAAITEPFLPALDDDGYAWWPPVISADQRHAVVADRAGRLFRLTRDTNQAKVLQAAGEARLELAPSGTPLFIGSDVWVPVRDGGQDSFRRFQATDFQPLEPRAAGGALTWGPWVVQDRIWAQRSDGTVIWSGVANGEFQTAGAPQPPLIGAPWPIDNGVLAATIDGDLLRWTFSGDTLADEVQTRPVGGPCASGPVAFSGDRFLVAGADGTLHVIPWSDADPAATGGNP